MGQFEAFIGVNPWTALFTLLNTLTIFFVAKKFLFGPVMKMIEDRQKEIDDMYDAAAGAKNSAAALESEYQQKLSAASETSERMVKEAVTRGQKREEEIIRQANQEANAIRSKAAADIAQEKKRLLMMLRMRLPEWPWLSPVRWWAALSVMRIRPAWWIILSMNWVSRHDKCRGCLCPGSV